MLYESEPQMNTPASQSPDDFITPQKLYLTRRQFLKAAGIVSASAFLAACLGTPEEVSPTNPALVDIETKRELAENYNNYYEFSLSKTSVAGVAQDFSMRPWQVEVGGLVKNPKKYSIDDILARFPQEERVYRMRCVEGWSMVIPWLGFPLQKLLNEVQPTDQAKYVRFVTLLDTTQFPGQNRTSYPWPYVEGLRLDEAMHDLTILATGLYGKDLPPQNGSPIRLVVPWKYGFKSIKSIVRIELVAEEPQSLWMKLYPEAYGFYANVNPDVPHPRWSQATEMRIGDNRRRKTLMFNGYEEQVAHLYQGMDLNINY